MDYVAGGLEASLRATFLLAAALFACGRMGCAVIRRWLPSGVLSRAETIVFGLGIGLTGFSAVLFCTGIAGHVSRWATGVILMLFAAAPILLRRPEIAPPAASAPPNPADRWCLAAAMIVFFLAWIQALTPSISMDALAYHLYLPEQFIRLGRIAFLPQTRESLWPLNIEMLFMAGLQFQGTQLAQLFHWCFYPLTAAAVYLCAARYWNAATARWAAVFFIFTPAAFAQSGHAYVDLSLAFYAIMAVFAFLLACERGEARAYALAGFFCGAAMAMKFLGLGILMILGPLVFWTARRRFRSTAAFASAALLIGMGWYLRSWWITGNPVYPLFPSLFGGKGYAIDMAEGVSMGKDLPAFLLFLWNVTMHPRAFGGEIFGAIFLAFLPVLCVLRPSGGSESRMAAPRQLAVFAVAYLAFIFSQSQHVRFLISAAPFLAIGAGAAFERSLEKGRVLKITACAVAAALLVMHGGIFLYRLKEKWPVAAGRVRPDVWLERNERSFRGFEYLKNHMKPSDRLLNAAEVRYFYGPTDPARVKHLPQEMARLKREGISFREYLEKENFDYIWIADNPDPQITDYLRNHGYALVFRYTFTEKPDTFTNLIYNKSHALSGEQGV